MLLGLAHLGSNAGASGDGVDALPSRAPCEGLSGRNGGRQRLHFKVVHMRVPPGAAGRLSRT